MKMPFRWWRDSDEWFALIAILAVVGFVIACAYGYAHNIYLIANSTDVATPMFVLRCIGLIVVPLGMFMGWI